MMARPESQVDHTVPALGMLAEYLRRLRRTAGLSYGDLAARSDCSAAHLKRAASGWTLPARPVMLAYVGGMYGGLQACLVHRAHVPDSCERC